MGAAAGGIAVAGPVITTFAVPAAAALTSECGCSDGKSIFSKEYLWTGTAWTVSNISSEPLPTGVLAGIWILSLFPFHRQRH